MSLNSLLGKILLSLNREFHRTSTSFSVPNIRRKNDRWIGRSCLRTGDGRLRVQETNTAASHSNATHPIVPSSSECHLSKIRSVVTCGYVVEYFWSSVAHALTCTVITTHFKMTSDHYGLFNVAVVYRIVLGVGK